MILRYSEMSPGCILYNILCYQEWDRQTDRQMGRQTDGCTYDDNTLWSRGKKWIFCSHTWFSASFNKGVSVVLSYISKIEGNLVWLFRTFSCLECYCASWVHPPWSYIICMLLYLHHLLWCIKNPCICFFIDAFSILSYFNLTDQLLVGVPQIGQPYSKIGSVCLPNRDSACLMDTFWLVLIACRISKDALCALAILSSSILVKFPFLENMS